MLVAGPSVALVPEVSFVIIQWPVRTHAGSPSSLFCMLEIMPNLLPDSLYHDRCSIMPSPIEPEVIVSDILPSAVMFMEDIVVVFEVVVSLPMLALVDGKRANVVPKIANEAAMIAAANLAFIVHGVNFCNI